MTYQKLQSLKKATDRLLQYLKRLPQDGDSQSLQALYAIEELLTHLEAAQTQLIALAAAHLAACDGKRTSAGVTREWPEKWRLKD